MFKDVVSGNNDLFALVTNGVRTVGCCTAGPGFDAASGLGGVILSNLSLAAGEIVRKLVNVGISLPTQRHPVRDGHLLARVSCSGRCLMGAYAKIQIGRSAKALTQYSNVYLLKRRSSKTIRIGLDRPTLRKLRSGVGPQSSGSPRPSMARSSIPAATSSAALRAGRCRSPADGRHRWSGRAGALCAGAGRRRSARLEAG